MFTSFHSLTLRTQITARAAGNAGSYVPLRPTATVASSICRTLCTPGTLESAVLLLSVSRLKNTKRPSGLDSFSYTVALCMICLYLESDLIIKFRGGKALSCTGLQLIFTDKHWVKVTYHKARNVHEEQSFYSGGSKVSTLRSRSVSYRLPWPHSLSLPLFISRSPAPPSSRK